MADRLKNLRRAGGPVGFLADVLSLAQQQWGLIMSALVATIGSLWGTTFKLLNDAHVQTFGSVFLWALWSYIGVSILYRLHNGIKTSPLVDYGYGIFIENIGLAVDQYPTGNAQPNLSIRNTLPAAIKMEIKECRVVLNGRTNPDKEMSIVTIPRIATKGIATALFPKNDLIGKGRIEGQLDLTIHYGPHDGDAVRRFKFRCKLIIDAPEKDGAVWGLANEHILETDEPL